MTCNWPKSACHSLHFLKPFKAWIKSQGEVQKSNVLQATWIAICWKVIMEFLPDDTKNKVLTSALSAFLNHFLSNSEPTNRAPPPSSLWVRQQPEANAEDSSFTTQGLMTICTSIWTSLEKQWKGCHKGRYRSVQTRTHTRTCTHTHTHTHTHTQTHWQTLLFLGPW